MKVLLVDDTKTECLVLSFFLEEMVHTVVMAENGKQAVELYHVEKPGLVLLDVIMPEMDGHEAARQMRRKLINVSTELEIVNFELKKLANVDGLTGLANRRYLDKYLRVEIS